MHPLFRRASRLALYCFAAAIAGVLLAAALRLLTPRPWLDALAFAVPAALIYGLAVLSAWWVCRANPLSGGLSTLLAQLGAALQASGLWTGASAMLGVLLARVVHLGPGPPGILRDLAALFIIGVPLYLLSAVVHYLLLAFEASHAAERQALESRVSAREAELRALRAQLNPHFLFNSLNSINALVGSDPEGARRMCERLGDFLRRTLTLGARESVTLGEELALVDRYLEIEQVRFGDRLRVERGVDPTVLDHRVPPLLLQPLVENAIKHGVQDAVNGGAVRLEARREGSLLVLTVENPFDGEAPARRGEGVGLENVRRRLAAFGSRDARLVAGRVGDRFRVRLELPVAPDETGGTGG
jgi:two-component system, LytTR family, sensor histidine kinase AlgZ